MDNTPSRQSPASATETLLRLAQLAEAIARRNLNRIRVLFGVGLAAAALLSYELWRENPSSR